MRGPLFVDEIAQADLFRPAPVEEARSAGRKRRRLDGVVEGIAEFEDAGVGSVR
jgi:hypothetical protein